MEIRKFSGQDSENILEWMEHWNRGGTTNGWSPENDTVMFPLYIVGRALQYFRTLPIEIVSNIEEIQQEFKQHFNCDPS